MAGELELGPVQVYFGTAGSELDIGPTEGGVVVNFGMDVQDLMTDQTGTTPQDQVISGQPTSVTCPLASISFSNLGIALNQSVSTAGACTLITGTNLTGTKLKLAKAKSLLLKKFVGGVPSTSPNDYFRFPQAAPAGTFELTFSRDGQRVIETEFRTFPDSLGNSYYIGDETAD